MKLIKISPSCYYTTSDEKGDRPTLGYIKTSSQTAIMIDAGNSEDHASEFISLLRKNSLPLPSLSIITHSHWDHTFGMSYFPLMPFVATEETAKLIATKNAELISDAKKIYRELGVIEANLFFEGKDNETQFCLTKLEEEYGHDYNDIKLVEPTFLVGKNKVNIPSIYSQIEVFAFPESVHSKDALLIYAKNEKVLYAGDAFYENFNVKESKCSPKKGAIALYNAVSNIDFDYCIMGHQLAKTKEETLAIIKKLFYL